MTARTRNVIGGVLVGIALLLQLNKLTGAQTHGLWVSPNGEWSAEVLYRRPRLSTGPTKVSVRILCVDKNLIMRAKFLGVVERPSAIDSAPGFVAIDSGGFTIGPGSLYGADDEAFVFDAPNCEDAVPIGA